MISQNCPKCRSSRVRKGYRPTPFIFKLIGRYNLLCDGCNLEFRGFAVPFTVNHSSRRSNRTVQPEKKAPVVADTINIEELSAVDGVSDEK